MAVVTSYSLRASRYAVSPPWSSSFASLAGGGRNRVRARTAGRAYQSGLALSTFVCPEPIDEAAQERVRETSAIEPPDPVLRGHPGQLDTEAITNLARGLHRSRNLSLRDAQCFMFRTSSLFSSWKPLAQNGAQVMKGTIGAPVEGYSFGELLVERCAARHARRMQGGMKRLLWPPWLRLLVIPQAIVVQPLAEPRPSVCPTGHGVDVRGVAPDPDLQLRGQDDCLAPLAPCGCPKFLIQRFLQVICRHLLAAAAFVIHDQQCVSVPLGQWGEERNATSRTSGVMLGVYEDVEHDLPDGQRLVTGQQTRATRVPCPCPRQGPRGPAGSSQYPGRKQGAEVRIAPPGLQVRMLGPGDDVGRTRIVAREAQHVFRIRRVEHDR